MTLTPEREKTAPCKISVLRRADVESNASEGAKIYFGLAGTSFNERFRNHNKDFNQQQYRKSTELRQNICGPQK